MKIEILKGTDTRVYQLIGPYAMDTGYIRRNGNPITTSPHHSWYVGFDEKGKMLCFCSLKSSASTKNVQIANLHNLSGQQEIFETLINRIIQITSEKGLILRSYAHNSSLEAFLQLGFEISRHGVNWHILTYNDSLRSDTEKD
ncbi:MAG: hypothetical protein LBD45_00275 [Bacteroidales bacterium]|jgi:hypothetical protein|nr:hypothetical protein [Bacteroidales bacterium]